MALAWYDPSVAKLTGPRSSRRLWVILGLLGLFILCDFALFSWLILRTLSRRELDRVLLETKSEALSIAGRIAGSAERSGGDLFTAVALEQETQTYIDSVLRQRQIVQTVEITDKNGVLVMKERREMEIAAAAPLRPPSDHEIAPGTPHVETRTVERQDAQPVAIPPGLLQGLDVTVPIGQFGSLRIGLSPIEMERRIVELRRDLVRQTAIIGSLTLGIVVLAFILISTLARRGQRLAAQAAEAERLAELGRLAAGLAHEIRNPLNSLNLNLQMLEEERVAAARRRTRGGEGGSSEPAFASGGASAGGSRGATALDVAAPESDTSDRLFEITRSEIGRLERLVTDFLSYARPRALSLQGVAMAALAERARVVMAREFLHAGATLEIVDQSDGASVRVDPEQMQQLLINLLQNALAATEGTGRDRAVRIEIRRAGPRVELDVVDNGRGIAAEEEPRIFEIFYSTRKGGTGLGLAIARRVARAHAGDITFESRPGEGSTFRVALPLATAAPAA
jgi:signal transduction histidine kinase